MPERRSKIRRIIARVRCLLRQDWLGRAGKRFRQTTTIISDFSEERLHLRERLEEVPDLGWKAIEGAASEKHAKAMHDYAEEEGARLDSELKRRTLESNVRQAKASADKMESEARVAQISEMDARLQLFDKLRLRGALPVWDDEGNMTVLKAPSNFDWDTLQNRLLQTGGLLKLSDISEAQTRQSSDETTT